MRRLATTLKGVRQRRGKGISTDLIVSRDMMAVFADTEPRGQLSILARVPEYAKRSLLDGKNLDDVCEAYVGPES